MFEVALAQKGWEPLLYIKIVQKNVDRPKFLVLNGKEDISVKWDLGVLSNGQVKLWWVNGSQTTLDMCQSVL